MQVWELIEEIEDLCNDGYGAWEINFCDDDDDCFTVNSIYYDDDGDVCLEASDDEGLTNYTADEILAELREYDEYGDVYFCEDFDEYYCIYDIDDDWYIEKDDGGNDFLCIDCYKHGDD